MSSHLITGVLAAVAIAAAPAIAVCAPQDPITPPSDETPAMQDQTGAMNAAPAAQNAGTNTSGVVMSASQMPAGQVQALQNGDNKLVANAPVPDTPANRAKYGRPLSNGGTRTPPVGN